MFYNIHNHTEYSILDGLTRIDQMCQRAAELGHEAVGLTDHGSMGGAVEFYLACKANDVLPLIGQEFYIVDDTNAREGPGDRSHLTLVAKTIRGYQGIVKLATWSNERENYHYRPRIDLSMIDRLSLRELDGIVCLSGCLAGQVAQAAVNMNAKAAEKVAKRYANHFPHYYLELMHHTTDDDDTFIEVIERLVHKGYPYVVTNDTHYLDEEDRRTHEVLLAIQTGATLDNPNRLQLKGEGYWFKSQSEIEEVIGRKLVRGASKYYQEILEGYTFKMPVLDKYSYSIKKMSKDPIDDIRSMCEKKLKSMPSEYRERFEYEIEVIDHLGFGDYMLLVALYAQWARGQGILINTRGSASSCLINYLLEITNVDPLRFGLMFERFINPERVKLPDIDLDIEDSRRDEVIQHLIDTYGADTIAMVGTYGSMTSKSVLSRVGKALGVPEDKLKVVSGKLDRDIESTYHLFDRKQLGSLDSQYPELYPLMEELYEGKQNLGTHAAGLVVGTEDRPLNKYIPTALIASSGKTVTQFHKDDLSLLGYVKLDLLGSRTLTTLKYCLELVGMKITEIPLDDTKTFEMICSGEVVGVFTLEGGVQKRGCMQLQPRTVEDVITVVSLYRPACVQRGDDKTYLTNRANESDINYHNQILKEVLSPSYNVIIFQEQIMQVCYAIGFTHTEQQLLMAALSLSRGGHRSVEKAGTEFDKMKKLFTDRAKDKGFTDKDVRWIWKQMRGYAQYGFNKAHATSYGLLAYQMAYLKANYPVEFSVALLETAGSKKEYLLEAQRLGQRLFPPDVNTSDVGFKKVGKRGIRFGFTQIKGVGDKAAKDIVAHQPYSDYDDFLQKVTRRIVNVRVIDRLQQVGALTSIGVEPSTDTRASEKELLGLVLSHDKLTSAKKKVIDKYVGTPKNRRRIESENEAYLGGVVLESREIVDRKKKKMAFLDVGYEGYIFNVTVFASMYRGEVRDACKEGSVLVIKATRSDDGTTWILEEVALVES